MSEQSVPYRTNRDLFSNHYLNDHLRQTESWKDVTQDEVRGVYDEIQELWNEKKDRVVDYNEAQLERNFIRPIFDILGIPFEIEETVMRNARRPDYGFFPSVKAADAAFDRNNFYEEAIAVADAKRWGRKLDSRGEEKRDFENPSYQIHAYLQDTPPQWAVLTNGKKWRLYHGPTSHRLDSYYEIDLPEILQYAEEGGNLQDFKEFYLFFRQEAFLSDQSGDCFLDDVYAESSVFAEAIGEDLQNNIYEAIRVLAEGFLDTNDNLGEDDLGLIHDSSLIYLYRLIFILYAESEGRDLLPTDNDVYRESYSLNDLKQRVAENRDETQQHYQTWQMKLWDRLEELFVLINQGSRGKEIPKDQLYIPAYNGGLFRTDPEPDDSPEARFLAAHQVDDAHLAEVIDLLTRREADEGDGQVFVDYSSLDERHLGSIYEGLLEYKLDVAKAPLTVESGEYSSAENGDVVAVEKGEVYLRTDAGERKATGSFYTPEYVVEYIVDETLSPLVGDIREDLLGQDPFDKEGGGQFAEDFADRVFDLKILDPAMGSGHFLVNAVDYLAREIIDAQERQDKQAVEAGDEEHISDPMTEEGELRDINWARRKVAQRCLYGVDLNPLATELAKVSLWLRTLAAEQPLAFLDHHLKTGNSLVGSEIEEILEENGNESDSGQLTLQQSFAHTRQQALEHVMDRFQDLLSIDNETLEDVKKMEQMYEEVRDDSLYQHLIAIANVHTADEFGLDIPGDAAKRMAGALRNDSWEEIEGQGWFQSAQSMAKNENFFHWGLEFPVVFYGEDGIRKEGGGFDAVIGNPPYVRQEQLSASKQFFEINYGCYDSAADLYVYFLEKGQQILRKDATMGYIVSNKFVHADYGEEIRESLSKETQLRRIVDFNSLPVFSRGVSAYPAIVLADKAEPSDTNLVEMAVMEHLDFEDLRPEVENRSYEVPQKSLGGGSWNLQREEVRKLLSKIHENSDPLSAHLEVPLYRGILTGLNEAFILSKEEKEDLDYEGEHIKPLLKGKDVHRFEVDYNDRYLLRIPSGWTKGESGIRDEEEAWEWFSTQFPSLSNHLADFETKAKSRHDRGEFWWELRPCDYYDSFEGEKIVYPVISKGPNFALDREGYYINDKLYTIPGERLALLGILNSNLIHFWLQAELSGLRGGYQEFRATHVEEVPISDDISKSGEIQTLVKDATNLRQQLEQLNLNLPSYLGNYEDGPVLPDIGLFQPMSSSILNATTEDYEKLQLENVRTKRDGNDVSIEATARYKPQDEDTHETDTWGYTETDYQDAFQLTDLTDEEAALVEAFVPVAVEEEIGGFRDNATQTCSLIDRLKDIELPDIDDVQDDLERYIETKERADKLKANIKKTDQLIDDIVYDLYNLTDEEIKIVEKTVSE